MTIAEQWRQEGEDKGRKDGLMKGRKDGLMKGRKEGLMKGRKEGRQAIFQRLLVKRFGQDNLEMPFQERMRKATPEQLDSWAEKLLSARNIQEVFRDN